MNPMTSEAQHALTEIRRRLQALAAEARHRDATELAFFIEVAVEAATDSLSDTIAKDMNDEPTN